MNINSIAALRDKINQLDGGEYGIFMDGPIDITCYSRAKFRILWILKEAVGDYGACEYNSCLIDNNIINNSFCPTLRVVSYVSYAILNNKNYWDDIPTLYGDNDDGSAQALKEIAIINIKKSMGEKRSSNSNICGAFIENKDLIFNQIETYNPDFVIMGFPEACSIIVTQIIKRFNPETPERRQNGDCTYYLGKDRVYLWAYHPGKPGNGATYCEEIIQAVVDSRQNA